MYIENAKDELDAALFVCPATQEINMTNSQTIAHGRCMITEGEEDFVYAEFTCKGVVGACSGKFNITDGEGQFNRTDIPNGFITVEVSRDGYRTPDPQNWALTPGGIGDFRFEMAPGEDPEPEFEGDEQNARPPEWGADPEE